MGFISLGGNSGVPQPSGLKEELIRQIHNRVSITGVQRRIWLADKHQVSLTWSAVNLTDYATLSGYLYNGGNTIVYANSITGITFTGFATVAEDDFIQGASWLKNLKATILEV